MALDITKVEKSLREERDRLVHQLHELGADETGELRSDLDFGGSFADAAAVTAERTEILGLVETLKAQLDAIDHALERIEAGNYGVCEVCGQEIGEDRLAFRPESVLCVDCKSKATA
ncbi:MAG: TraR/DksA family transcriptional regulator [Acidimicrobiia bacterium]